MQNEVQQVNYSKIEAKMVIGIDDVYILHSPF